MATEVGPIEAGEIKLLKFNASSEMEALDTITLITRSIEMVHGIDETPENRFVGAAVVSGQFVLQRFQAGLTGNCYKVRMLVTDSSGLVHALVATVNVAF